MRYRSLFNYSEYFKYNSLFSPFKMTVCSNALHTYDIKFLELNKICINDGAARHCRSCNIKRTLRQNEIILLNGQFFFADFSFFVHLQSILHLTLFLNSLEAINSFILMLSVYVS